MKHVVLYVGHLYKPFWTKKIWPGWQGGSGKVKIMHFCTFPIEMTQMCHILTFPDPPCQPGQIFLVQNGLHRCPTCSTTCFMLNSYLWGVFLALWSQIVKLFHKIYILSNEGFPKTLDVDNVILKMTNYIPHRLKESLSPNRNISFSGQISLKI